MATRQTVFSYVFPAGGGNRQVSLTVPGTEDDSVTFLGATQYSLDAGAVANLATVQTIDTSTVHLDRTIIWLTGMTGVTVPVEGGSTVFLSATNGLIVQLSFAIESAPLSRDRQHLN